MQTIRVLACLWMLGCGAAPPPDFPTPNLFLLIGDDVGYRDFGFMGSPYVQTPHLDRLAREGTVFTRGFSTASTCRPALRSLLTGLHPHQWQARVEQLQQQGVFRGPTGWIRDFETLPRLLMERGYWSFQAGKFWEASHRIAGFTHGMEEARRGFFGGSGTQFGRTTTKPLYDFLGVQRGLPVFVWFAPMLPHLPHDADAAYQQLYADLPISEGLRGYYANITRFDALVGDLLGYLEEKQLRDRSLIVYVSDNGWEQGPRRSWFPHTGGPKGKGSLYELGLRTPIVFHWPGRIPSGVIHDDLVSSVDLVPTLLDYAGARVPEILPGRSLRSLIEGGGGWTRREVIGGRPMPHRSLALDEQASGLGRYRFFLRTPKWHYIWLDGDGSELYDMETDPEQQQNLADRHPELVARFRARIQEWQAEVERPFRSDLDPEDPVSSTVPLSDSRG